MQEINPLLCKRVWNECGESVHKHLNKTFSTLDSHNGTRKGTDDSDKFSPNKHKLNKIKSNTKKEEVKDVNRDSESVSLPKNNNGNKERNNV